MASVLLHTSLPGLKLLSKGKVRDVYELSADPSAMLFVATDRISAYDVILKNGVPEKGRVLTNLSLFWFKRLESIVDNHLVTAVIAEMPEEVQEFREQLEGRCMVVRKAEVIPLEAIVRGYITGSGWSEYKKYGTVHGIQLPPGLAESQKLDEPLFTPSTKAEQGSHDENIHPDKAVKLIGQNLYDLVSSTAVKLYSQAAEYALARGIILADTKFEFGLLPISPLRKSLESRLILIDEVLTPDSSRYWPVEGYISGRSQPSFDKQYLRDWMVSKGFKRGQESGPPGAEGEGWSMPAEVVIGTEKRYLEVQTKLILNNS